MLLARALVPTALLLVGCATQVLPPPPVPPHDTSTAMPSDPPAAGTGRILLDVVGEHVSAELITLRTESVARGGGATALGYDATTTPLCTTPCIVDLPLGSHEIRFAGAGAHRTDSDFVVAAPRPTVFRYAPGESHPRTAAQVLGALAIGLGAPCAVIGGIVIAGQKDTVTSEARTGVVAFTAASAGLLALGILAFAAFPPTYQPASSTQWESTR